MSRSRPNPRCPDCGRYTAWHPAYGWWCALDERRVPSSTPPPRPPFNRAWCGAQLSDAGLCVLDLGHTGRHSPWLGARLRIPPNVDKCY